MLKKSRGVYLSRDYSISVVLFLESLTVKQKNLEGRNAIERGDNA